MPKLWVMNEQRGPEWTAMRSGHELAREVLARGGRTELGEDTEHAEIFWIRAEGDSRQHASTVPPPPEGGPVPSLGGHGEVLVSPSEETDSPSGEKSGGFCEECFAAYVAVPVARPRWSR